ncbi:hypothetical protein IEQ34_015647 [Dendrobium chrysotoxum]|uniref:DUF4378 domain-containing protein n=1 Tax=Dendrobium chrysotoxum TaxID=161865 RepID=A0AAV7GII3_DENCH|nr:hypothetical protein IEQ34_015647 [Dendrobium chrysotoxum]
MSAKVLHIFSEENSELQKQIGCMTGIFQMFDRHNLLGGRRFKGGNNKKIPSGNSFVNVSNCGTDNATCSPQLVLEKNLSENQRMSMESSGTSFSSSSGSSFSSIECNKSALQGPTSFKQANFSNKSANNSPKSESKEPQSLSVKSSYKEEFKQHVLTYINSPRPMHLSNSMDGSYVINGIDSKKSRSHLDQNESFRVLMKIKEAPWTFEAKEVALNRQFSYDGREISTNFLDSCENGKRTSKLREFPRLSLDSRESSMKSSNSIMKDFDRSRSKKENNLTYSNAQKESGSKKSVSSVVAKLMGLEAIPTLCSNHEEQVDSINNCPLNTSNDVRASFDSPRSSQKNLTKHSEKNPVAISKPSCTAKTQIELAPWKKQKKKIHVTQNTLKQQPETVYSEIEKRLKELEFHHANKDLRALKQILDAIQAKGSLESKKNEHQHSPKLVTIGADENLRSPIAQKLPLLASTKRISTRRTFDKPIVIMKPAKLLNRFDVSATSSDHLNGFTRIQRLRTSEAVDRKKEPFSSKLARDCSPRASPRINGKTEENGQKSCPRTELGSSKPQQYSRDNNEKSSYAGSPRLLQKRLEVERRIPSLVSSSDSSKHQNLLTSKQPSESVSPRIKLGSRPTISQLGDEMSQRSDSNMSSASQLDMEDTSAKKNFASPEQGGKKNPPDVLDEEASTLALAAVGAEQPSPISILDATYLHDDLPFAAVKRSTNVSKGNKLPNSDNVCKSHKIDSENNQKKLERIGNLLQKLDKLSSTTERTSTTDHIALLCETQNPNHRYISEILLASGLLMKDLSSAPSNLMPIQLQPTGQPINPDLFLVLEQTKSSQVSKSKIINESTSLHCNFDIEKLHRKLVFDVVNEVLVQKLEHPMILPARKLEGRLPSGQQLLKQLCSEIDQLHTEVFKSEDPDDDEYNILGEEILQQLPVDWNDYRREIPCIVLDIERSIFKDMIDELVCGEASSLKYKSSRRHRQLFAK